MFIPIMLISTIDFYHLLPPSLTLTLAGGLKVSASQNRLAQFPAHFSTDKDEIWFDIEANLDINFEWDLIQQRK